MKHNIKKELYNLKFLAKKVVQASPGYVLAAFVESWRRRFHLWQYSFPNT